MTVSSEVRRSRLQLLALVAIAVVPLVASYLLYSSVQGEGPWATTNHGELLDPMPSAQTLKLADGQSLDGHWWLLVVEGQRCEAACQHAVEQLRALHVLLNKDAERVRRGVVDARAVLGADPGLAPVLDESGLLGPGIYIVDPIGNVVLRYDYEAAGKPVLEDLKRLLKVSHIG